MTIIEARNAPKVTFPKIVAIINSHGVISGEQRARRGRREQAAAKGEARRKAVATRRSAQSATGDEIKVNLPLTRRRRATSLSPSAGLLARNAARGRGRALTRGRGGRSTRSRNVA
jgi:hypothetical protein